MIPESVARQWLDGDPVRPMAFYQHDPVWIARGPAAGSLGRVTALLAIGPDPSYSVELPDGRAVAARQSELLAAPATGEAALLGRLQRWYAAQCDGRWEHDDGPAIETLDNPGWRVRIPLERTALAGKPFPPIQPKVEGRHWVSCSVRDDWFEGFGGPHQLGRILAIFLDWAESAQ